MPRNYPAPAWSPYLVGAGIGVLSWLTFYFSDKPIGASSFYATVAGFSASSFAPTHTESLKYYKDNPPRVDWELCLRHLHDRGRLHRRVDRRRVPQRMAAPDVGASLRRQHLRLRAVVGFAGGVLMAFGARLAGGCTSGHGISGTMQLNVGSWIAVICFFVGGIAAAMLLYTVAMIDPGKAVKESSEPPQPAR